MARYIFNLEIEPKYHPQPMAEELTGKYNETIALLEERGFLGRFSIREDGKMERGFHTGLETRGANLDIFDTERRRDMDFTDPAGRERLMSSIPSHSSAVANMIRFLLLNGVGSSKKLSGITYNGDVKTPLGAQSAHFHYEGGGLDYFVQRRSGLLRRKNNFLKEVAMDYELRR